MNPIDKANFEVVADVFETAMTALKKEGIDEQTPFLSSEEYNSILEEVNHRVTQGRETPEEISDWVQTRLTVLIKRPKITKEQEAIFEDLDSNYGLAA